MQRFKITISYDGTEYFGWQVQPEDVSVQGTIEKALHELSGESIKVHGSGRTDQGVHARGQVAHFDIEKKFTERGMMRALNALLPEDIRILSSKKVCDSFHARKTVKTKEYRYFIWNDEVLPPFQRSYRTHVRTPLDVDKMAKAAKYLVGRHSFKSFSANRRKEEGSYVRDLYRLDVKKKGSEIVIIAQGSGFLYKMVRSIAGYLIRVGKGKAKPAETKKILKAEKRTQHVETAPPQGLFLWKVRY